MCKCASEAGAVNNYGRDNFSGKGHSIMLWKIVRSGYDNLITINRYEQHAMMGGCNSHMQ